MQHIDLYQPIAGKGPAPLVLRVLVGQSNYDNMLGGVPASQTKVENYVLLSALPEELRQRVELAVQFLITSR